MRQGPRPRWAHRLLRFFLRGDDAEFIVGDLVEEYRRTARRAGLEEARSWYRRQVLHTVWDRMRRPIAVESFVRDARHVARGLAHTPGYTVVAVTTLAFGIGGAIAVTALSTAVLRPLPLPEADALVAVWEERNGSRRWVSPANYLDWRRESATFSGLASHGTRVAHVTVEGRVQREAVAEVSGNFFQVVGASPEVGRAFSPTLDVAFAEREAVLSRDGALTAFGAAHLALGRDVIIDDEPYRVVGVADEGFTFPEPELFAWLRAPSEVPPIRGLPVSVALPELRDSWYFEVVGRLARGSTIEAARAEMRGLAARLAEMHPDTNTGSGIRLVPLLEQTIAGFGRVLAALGMAVILLLGASVFNVFHLTTARSQRRRTDAAIRASLGATRAQLVRLHVLEGCIVGLFGAVFGSVGAYAALRTALNRTAEAIPRAAEVGFTPTFAVVAGLLGAAVGSLLGAAAFSSSAPRRDVRSGLGSPREGRALIGVQVAISVAVLTLTTLLGASLWRLAHVDLGFTTADVSTLRVSLPDAGARSYAERVARYAGVVRAIAAQPGVASVGLGVASPLQTGPRAGVWRDGTEPTGDPPDSGWQPIDHGYFTTLAIPLLRGRAFAPDDTPDAPDVAIVNEAFVRSVLDGREPLGARVSMGLDGHDRPLTIVGVVGDTRTRGPAEAPFPVVYRPFAQTDRYGAEAMFIAIRSAPGIGARPGDAVRAAMPGLPVYDEASGVELSRTFRSTQTLLLSVMAIFGSLALSIGLVGVYGVCAHAVRRRRREIGVRLALGATSGRITRETMARGLGSALLGVVPGIMLALLAGRAVGGMLFEVSATDPRAPIVVSTFVLALTACTLLVPARLASSTDPSTATKAD